MFKIFKSATNEQIKAIYEINELLSILIKVSLAGYHSWRQQEGYQVFTNGDVKNLSKAIDLNKEIEVANSNFSQAKFQKIMTQFKDCSSSLLIFSMDTLASSTENQIIQDMLNKYLPMSHDHNESILSTYSFFQRNFSALGQFNAFICSDSLEVRLQKLKER